MAISEEQTAYVANLARLDLAEEDIRRFAVRLDAVLEYMEKLNELDTGDTEPLVHLSDRENVFRSDQPAESLSRREALENAPEKAEGCFKVPSIIE